MTYTINMTYCIPDFCLRENEEEYVIDHGIEKRSLLLSMYHECGHKPVICCHIYMFSLEFYNESLKSS